MSNAIVAAIGRRRNSAGVRPNASSLREANLNIKNKVETCVYGEEIIIRLRRKRAILDELMTHFDPEQHRHKLALDVQAVGKKVVCSLRTRARGHFPSKFVSPGWKCNGG